MLRFQCLALAAVALSATFTASAVRSQRSLKQWDFSRDSLKWDKVTIPHDWAIYGPFDRNNDLHSTCSDVRSKRRGGFSFPLFF